MNHHQCYFHKSYRIIKFCTIKDCTLPLCQICQPIHNQQHQKNHTKSQIISFINAHSKAVSDLQSIVTINKDKKNQLEKQIKKQKQLIIDLIENYFQQIYKKIQDQSKNLIQVQQQLNKIKKGSLKGLILYYSNPITNINYNYSINQFNFNSKNFQDFINQLKDKKIDKKIDKIQKLDKIQKKQKNYEQIQQIKYKNNQNYKKQKNQQNILSKNYDSSEFIIANNTYNSHLEFNSLQIKQKQKIQKNYQIKNYQLEKNDYHYYQPHKNQENHQFKKIQPLTNYDLNKDNRGYRHSEIITKFNVQHLEIEQQRKQFIYNYNKEKQPISFENRYSYNQQENNKRVRLHSEIKQAKIISNQQKIIVKQQKGRGLSAAELQPLQKSQYKSYIRNKSISTHNPKIESLKQNLRDNYKENYQYVSKFDYQKLSKQVLSPQEIRKMLEKRIQERNKILDTKISRINRDKSTYSRSPLGSRRQIDTRDSIINQIYADSRY